MNPPRNSITADRGHNKPTPKCVVCIVQQISANHTIPKARRSTRRPPSRRSSGVAALKEPANIKRLLEGDDDSGIEINERMAHLIAVESLTRWLTLLSEKQRVWLRHIAARLRRAA